MEKGLLHIYHGNGKGKTTAATGLAVRAAGHGLKVGFSQFLKDGTSGECGVLRTIPGITVFPAMKKVVFTFAMTAEQRKEAEAFYGSLLEQIAAARELDLIILDEVLDAVNADILLLEALLNLIRSRPEGQELVLTGRNPSAALLELADYVTEVRLEKHPYQRGIQAREGIEW